jgi:predicted transcriptional regulator
MKLREVSEILNCEVIGGENQLDMDVGVGCGADLMSDVLAFIKPNALLLSGLANAQVVRTADIADVRAIVFVRGKKPDKETIALAQEKGIPLLSTKLLMYESCGRLYMKGLRGGTEI